LPQPLSWFNPTEGKTEKTFFSVHSWLSYVLSWFSRFFLDEKESLKGITVFGERLSGRLHTSSLATNGVNTLTRVSFSARGFEGFC
jgi:hypothetical protein